MTSIAIIIIILICFKIMSVLLKIFSAKSNKKKILVTMIIPICNIKEDANSLYGSALLASIGKELEREGKEGGLEWFRRTPSLVTWACGPWKRKLGNEKE